MMVATSNLRRACRRLLRELGIQAPFEVARLCSRVAEHRGRAIRLVPHDIPASGPFGAWLGGTRTDYILYQQSTTSAHQDHIILHELAHMLALELGSAADHVLLAGQAAFVAPERQRGFGATSDLELDMDAVRRALRTGRYDQAHERNAETAATIILVWRTLQESISLGPGDRRFAALDDAVGWGI